MIQQQQLKWRRKLQMLLQNLKLRLLQQLRQRQIHKTILLEQLELQ
jgi:hypothetical protein